MFKIDEYREDPLTIERARLHGLPVNEIPEDTFLYVVNGRIVVFRKFRFKRNGSIRVHRFEGRALTRWSFKILRQGWVSILPRLDAV